MGERVLDWLRSIPARGWEGIRAIREPLLVFAATRGGLFLLVYLSLAILPLNTDPTVGASGEGAWRGFPANLLLDGWVRWDAGWYRDIAVRGYVNEAVGPSGQRNLAFYPLYPLAIRAVSVLVGDPLVAGMLVSNLAFLGALVLLHRMIRDRFGTDAATKSILLLSVFPFSFYFSAVYSEGLFLLLVVSAFYLAEKDRWLAASVCAMLSAATRGPGLALLPALGVLYLEKIRFDLRRVRLDVLWLGLCALGPGLFFLYLYVQFGDPWLQAKATRVPGWWPAGIDLKPVERALKSLFSLENLRTGDYAVVFNINILTAGAFLGSLFAVFKRQPLAYGVFSTLLVASGLLQPLGWGRYVAPAFPVFIAWSLALKSRWAFEGVLVISTLLLALLTIMFSHWYWIA